MQITYTAADYDSFLRQLENQLRDNGLHVSHINGDKLYTSRFYVRLFDGKLEIVPYRTRTTGTRLEAPLDMFLMYCHGCNMWHLDFSEFYRMEKVEEALYIKQWLEDGEDIESEPSPSIDAILEGLLSRLETVQASPPRPSAVRTQLIHDIMAGIVK